VRAPDRGAESSVATLRSRDIVVVTSKFVSRQKGRFIDLAALEPSERARELAQITRKDARLVEAILRETRKSSAAKPQRADRRHAARLILANCRIVNPTSTLMITVGACCCCQRRTGQERLSRLKQEARRDFNADIGVIISDSVGRPCAARHGGIAIGAAGVPSLWDRRGEKDLSGRPLEVTEVAFADAVAAVAVLAMGEAAEGRPAALVRGLDWSAELRPGGCAGPAQIRGPVPMSRRSRGRHLRLSSPAAAAGSSCRRIGAAAAGAARRRRQHPATIFVHLGLQSRLTSTPCSNSLAGLVNDETGWGRRGGDVDLHARALRTRRADVGSSWATVIWRRTSTARAGCCGRDA
jgi:coenzyme F420-0:L-glutamate ligase/coenzyme F420-1:gamma-L-glutamate ligase